MKTNRARFLCSLVLCSKRKSQKPMKKNTNWLFFVLFRAKLHGVCAALRERAPLSIQKPKWRMFWRIIWITFALLCSRRSFSFFLLFYPFFCLLFALKFTKFPLKFSPLRFCSVGKWKETIMCHTSLRASESIEASNGILFLSNIQKYCWCHYEDEYDLKYSKKKGNNTLLSINKSGLFFLFFLVILVRIVFSIESLMSFSFLWFCKRKIHPFSHTRKEKSA